MTLLPPNNTFFRLNVSDHVLDELDQEGIKTDVEHQLAEIEKQVMERVREDAHRVDVYEALKLLIVSGDALLYLPDEGGMEVFRLDQYVVNRNSMGQVLEIITKEVVDLYSLPEDIQGPVIREEGLKNADESELRDTEFDLFTHVRWDENDEVWKVKQEVLEMEIEDASGEYDENNLPWIPLRWTANPSQDYGIGLVEEYLGDFMTLESLHKSLVEGTTIASEIKFLVNPNGVTRASKIEEAENGAIIEGNPEDVQALQVEKTHDYQMVYETITDIEQRLKKAFLMVEAVQRQAERVTAEEIRTMAQELEDTLGGVYSLLALELQLPLVNRVMKLMEDNGELPDLPEDTVTPEVVTGIEALGRGHDLDKLMHWMQAIEALGPEVIQQYLNPSDFMKRAATALGIDTDGLIKSEEEVQQMMQQQQQQQQAGEMLDQIAPKMMEMVAEGEGEQAEEMMPEPQPDGEEPQQPPEQEGMI